MQTNVQTNVEQTGLKGVTYEKTILNANEEPERLQIPNFEEIGQPTMQCHPFYTYHNQIFNKERYLYSTVPIHLRNFSISHDTEITNVLRCPIKTAGNREIILPQELIFLKDFVEYCCIYETRFTDNFEDLFIHITVDYKKNIENYHRVPGWHVDGFQGHKFTEKHEIEHSYLWSSNYGTEFCVQPFFIQHVDDSKYMIFDELTKQAHDQNIIQCLPENIYIFDPYMVHRSPLIENVENERLLVRLTCEYQKLLDPNDAINPFLVFNAPFKYDIRNSFGTLNWPLNLELYGYQN